MFSFCGPTKARRSESFVGFFHKKLVLRYGISLLELLVSLIAVDVALERCLAS